MKIPVFEPDIGDKELANVIDCIETGWISGYKGKYIDEFEERFSAYCDCEYGITTTSCATALLLALESLEISYGDEVIVPAFTMIATVNAIIKAGATPVLVDSESDTWNINPNLIEDKITKRTKAIMLVHIYGHPCNMKYIWDLANIHNFHIIEDAAEAHGAEYGGKKTGSLGIAGCFSFYINKIITTGEGGMITTNNKQLAERARLLKSYATEPARRFYHEYIGFNYRMTNMQAAIGVGQLDKIEQVVERKRWIAEQYSHQLEGMRGLVLPIEAEWARNVYWVYGIRVLPRFGISRDRLIEALEEKGIETRTFFIPMHHQPCFRNSGLFTGDSHPISELLAEEGLYLPNSTSLTLEQISYVCDSIKGAGLQ